GIAHMVEIELPVPLRPFVIPKGFIAVNGVSLTVISCMPSSFSLALIPYTKQHTNLGEIQPGTLLNLETDIIGRYVVHLLEQSGNDASTSGEQEGKAPPRAPVSTALAVLQEAESSLYLCLPEHEKRHAWKSLSAMPFSSRRLLGGCWVTVGMLRISC